MRFITTINSCGYESIGGVEFSNRKEALRTAQGLGVSAYRLAAVDLSEAAARATRLQGEIEAAVACRGGTFQRRLPFVLPLIPAQAFQDAASINVHGQAV